MSAFTNQLDYKINHDLINERYIVTKVESSKKMKPSLMFLDSVLDNNGILSVCYTEFNEAFVLMENDQKTLYQFTNALADYDDLSFKKAHSETVKDSILIQLFINSLARSKISSFSYNNLSGHLYIAVNPDDKNKKQIKTIEIKIDKECCLQVDVRTFTSRELERFIEFKKDRNFSSYPQYALVDNRHLKRIARPEKNSYIMRQTRNRKSEVKFLDFQNLEKFNKSKCGIIQNVMEQFTNRYGDLITMQFTEIKEPIVVEHKSAMTRIEKTRLSAIFKETPVRIVDYVKTDLSADLSKTLVELFLEDGADVKESKYLKKNCYNVCVVHEKEKYQEGEDPHSKIEISGPNQCITVETYVELISKKTKHDALKNIKNTVVHELLIKDDIRKGKISTYDWSENNYSGCWRFIEKYKDNEGTKFCCMDIQPEGSFKITTYDYNLFSMSEYAKYENAFQTSKGTLGIVEDSQGNINCIVDTNRFTIPNLVGIKQELVSGNNKLKNKEKREDLLTSIIDVNYFSDDSGTSYYAGIAQDMLQYTANNATLIRKAEPVSGSAPIFNDLLPLMNVMFVKNGQLTVIPFPFKYIREYMNLES